MNFLNYLKIFFLMNAKFFAKRNFPLEMKSFLENPSFSQEGEDLILGRLLSNEIGFYLNIGAHDPVKYSNTYLLYKKGWRGLNIDPNPGLSKKFKKFLPEDKMLEIAVSDLPTEKKLEYFVYNESALNGFVDRSEILEAKNFKLVEKRLLSVVDIRTIVENFPFPSIDFLNIDVEGLDFKIIQKFPFEKSKPKLICIEVGPSEDERNEFIQFLRKYNYKLRSLLYNSAIFTLADDE